MQLCDCYDPFSRDILALWCLVKVGTECYGSKDGRNDQPRAEEELQMRADDAKAGQEILSSAPLFTWAARRIAKGSRSFLPNAMSCTGGSDTRQFGAGLPS